MPSLDDTKIIQKLDKNNILGSIELLNKQCQQAWHETKKIKIPQSYRSVKNVVINGMGGSGIGGHIIQSLYFDKLKVPLGIIHSYSLPACVNKDTLYIVSSYSGTTEEPLNTLQEAKKRGAKILAITTGKKLGELALKYKIPSYIFRPLYNTANEPRMGLGYSIFGQLGLLSKCQLIKIKESEIKAVANLLKNCNKKFGVLTEQKDNLAKKLARDLKNKIIAIVGAEFLGGNVHVLANQINENSKNFSTYFLIPELNHHLLEGLSFPVGAKNYLRFLFIESMLYFEKNQERFAITQKVLKRNKVEFYKWQTSAKSELLQSFETLSFGSYLSFYLAVLNQVNPAKIPWVDYFKRELAKK